MQEAKHTPGPWHYAPQDGRKNQKIDQFQEVVDELGRKIATISTTVWRQHHGPSAVANAHLIAAAPELLEALKPFAKAHEEWHGGNAAEYFSTAVCPADFLRAAEAVAKAMGKEGQHE